MAKSSNRNLYFAAAVACLTGALFGYSVGFIGGILVLPSFLRHFHLIDLPPAALASATSSTVTIWLLGALIGVPAGVPACSRWGKRGCLTLCAVLYVLGVSLQLMEARGWLALFNAGRLLNGIGVGAGTLVSPMYISEISTPSRRGMLLSGYQTAIQSAALAGFWAAFAAHACLPDSSQLQWKIPVAVQLLPGILLLLGTIAIPESPKFLADKGYIEAAEKSLGWLRGLPSNHPDVVEEFEELLDSGDEIHALDSQGSGFLRTLRDKSIRKRLGVGIGLMVAQNMVGLNALNYYSPVIFMSAGFTSVSSSLFLTGLFGIVKLLSATSFMFVFVRIGGNRFWLLFGSAICGISMIILAFCVQSLPLPSDSTHSPSPTGHSATAMVAVAMVYIFAFSFGISLGPLSWNVCSEIFPARVRTSCCAVTTCAQWLFQIVIAAITPLLLARVKWATYLIYAACCAASFVWVAYCVPETKGVKLGREMDELFTKGEQTGVNDACEVDAIDENTALLRRTEHAVQRRESIGFSV